MKNKHPTPEDIQELLAFLPAISAPDFVPQTDPPPRPRREDGIIELTFPTDHPLVDQFFKVAVKDCWVDYDYLNNRTREDFLRGRVGLEAATLQDLKALLTFFTRGERFSWGGFLGGMFKDGHVRQVLQRLAELNAQGALARPSRKRRVK